MGGGGQRPEGEQKGSGQRSQEKAGRALTPGQRSSEGCSKVPEWGPRPPPCHLEMAPHPDSEQRRRA